MNKIHVGTVLKPQGIKGEVKISSSIGSSLKKTKYLYIDNVRTEVLSVRIDGDFAYVALSTVSDRNHAEALRNKEIFVDRCDVNLENGNYLIDELIGAQVCFEDGSPLGELVEVIKNRKCADAFVVKTVDGEVLFPFLNDLVVSINPESKQITVNSKRFAETALTDDTEEV